MEKQNKHNQPLVSVIIPVYNGALFLTNTIKSVLKSDCSSYEIILVDDGSTDASKALCRELERKYPKKIRYFSFKKNKGLGNVLNFALKKAQGVYICRINQDDEMVPSRIRKQVDFLHIHPDVVLVGSWLLVEDENGENRINKFLEYDEDIKKTWLKLSPCWDASVMYKRETALKVGGYDQAFWPADDLHMWYRLGNLGKIANIQEPLVKIKFHTAAASVKYHRKHMITTYLVHQWANKHVEKASFITQVYWLCQLIAGYLIPARINWFVYGLLKKYIIYRPQTNQKQLTKARAFLVHS